jgi:hypothetical protein
MTPWLMGAGAYAALFAVLWVLTEVRVNRLRKKLREEADVTLAAVWLAQYNYARMAATEDVVLRLVEQSTQQVNRSRLADLVQRRLTAHEESPWNGVLHQTIPMYAVPPELRWAASTFNARVSLEWPERYRYAVRTDQDSVESVRIKQLQDALLAAQWADHQVLDDRNINDVARSAGVSYLHAEAVLRAFLDRTKARVEAALVDPETVLPSIY